MKYNLLSILVLLSIALQAQVFDWVRTAGLDGGGNDHTTDLEIDHNDEIVVCGRVKNPTNWGAVSPQDYGLKDIFVSKYDIDGNLLWVNRSGGGGDDYANNISIDSLNNIYVGGTFYDSCYFASSDGNGWLEYSSGKTGFFLAYDPNGVLLWVELVELAEVECVYADESGNIYAGGMFAQTSIFQGDTMVSQDEFDGFLLKLNASRQLEWKKLFHGNLRQRVGEIEPDIHGNIYITGMTRGDATVDSLLIDAPNGNYDHFIGKLTPQGEFKWLVPYGGNNQDVPSDLEYDAINDHIVFCGTRGTNGIVVRMDSASNILNSYTVDAITGIASAEGVHISSKGDVYVCGRYTNDLSFMGDTILTTKDYECYMIGLSDSLTEKSYKSFASDQFSNKFPIARDVVEDSFGDFYLAGEFLYTVDFDTIQVTSSGVSSDLVLAKIEMPIEATFDLEYQVYCDVQEVCFEINTACGRAYSYKLTLNSQSYTVTGDTCLENLALGNYDVSVVAYNHHHSDSIFVVNAFEVSNEDEPIIDTIYFDFPLLVYEGSYDSLEVFYNDSLVYTGTTADTSAFSPFFGNYYVVAYNSSGCYVFSDTIESVDGIDENGIIDIGIFPNPSTGVFYFVGNNNYEFSEVNVYSINGKLMHSQSFTGILDLRKLPNGVYLFEAIINGESIIKRIVKFE
jgi:hypothetical protein